MNSYRVTYFILGSIAFCLLMLFIILSIVGGKFMAISMFNPAIFLVICICNGYLAPQLQQQDERAKFIRQKGMFYSYFANVFYLMVLMALLGLHILVISALHVVLLITFLIVTTVFVSMVVVSKMY